MFKKSVVSASLLFAACMFLSACGPKPIMTRPTVDKPHTYVLFFDGTANRYESETNISKLRHRIAWQHDDTTGTYYIEGVGAGKKIVGMAMGYGLGYRIRDAYRYLLRNYSEGDRIILFGYSRGAFSARILASILQYGGLPDSPIRSGDEAQRVASDVFGAYKGKKGHYEREADINAALSKLGFDSKFEPRMVEVMGLWDTVKALRMPDRTEDDFKKPSDRYADQLCNVGRAFHAVSLDDNRALEFTPILLTRGHLVRNCLRFKGENRDPSEEEITRMLNDIVEEVWFTGAHADVGGGYDTGRLDGLSMNWMLSELSKLGLVKNKEPIRAHHLDCAHDAQLFMRGYVYNHKARSLNDYATSSYYNDGKLKLHSSVVSRLHGPLPMTAATREESWGTRSPVGLYHLFPKCFPNSRQGDFKIDFAAEGCRLSVAGGSGGGSKFKFTPSTDGSYLSCKELREELY